MKKEEPYIKTCPNGCESVLYDSHLILPEGILKCCPVCSQLISQCSQELYINSNQEWDSAEGTWPSKKDLKRLVKRREQTMKTVSKLLSKRYSEIRLLDVGCSNGAFIWIAKQLGIKAEGVEPAVKAAKAATELGLKVHLGFLENIKLPENAFDVITLFEVIEHISNPMVLLAECYRILCPGGILVIGTGNTNSWTRRILKSRWDFFDIHQHGGHINFYNPNSMAVLANNTGFSVQKTKTSAVKLAEKGDFPYLIYRILKIGSELLNVPTKILGKGHQMEVFLISNKLK
ncbi:class I SAM-dependent methyltransferase [Candidatus Parabeggiatoa sp. HSG14]|uniref:class I SAM-dependent methyltransferase n=1 Tax=Candidatus Parabeggiatoa sp. HSG14 TaxID=3055593 RepID=UPI0025A9004A|nr:class I SAM-dependent methyltransferase [Thiotrichales bacterium HSG14]